MSRKFGKFLLFSAVAGAAAYGTYYFLKSKDNTASSEKDEDVDDDFDDFSEDLDEDTAPAKERSYVSLNLNLDKAEAFASEAFHKAKEMIADSVQQVKDTVKAVTENQAGPETNFTDLTALNKEKEEDAAGEKEATPSQESSSGTDGENASAEASTEKAPDAPAAENVSAENTQDAPAAEPEPAAAESSASAEPLTEKVEEFFDDNP